MEIGLLRSLLPSAERADRAETEAARPLRAKKESNCIFVDDEWTKRKIESREDCQRPEEETSGQQGLEVRIGASGTVAMAPELSCNGKF